MNTPQLVITNPPADPPNQQFVSARGLLECLEAKKGEPGLRNDRWEIIQQIISAREKQEQYNAGQIGRAQITLEHCRSIDMIRWQHAHFPL